MSFDSASMQKSGGEQSSNGSRNEPAALPFKFQQINLFLSATFKSSSKRFDFCSLASKKAFWKQGAFVV